MNETHGGEFANFILMSRKQMRIQNQEYVSVLRDVCCPAATFT